MKSLAFMKKRTIIPKETFSCTIYTSSAFEILAKSSFIGELAIDRFPNKGEGKGAGWGELRTRKIKKPKLTVRIVGTKNHRVAGT